MATKIDEVDLKIIHHLQKDARASLSELAEKAGSSRQTAANRLKRLIDEERIVVKGGLNLRKFGFKMAYVGLEVKTDKNRSRVEEYLRDCPRVFTIFRVPEKANLHLIVWGEDEQTINSTIESFRDLQDVDIVYTRYLGTPIHGNVFINIALSNDSETPCGKKCADCHRYVNLLCLGCPISSDYKNPLLE